MTSPPLSTKFETPKETIHSIQCLQSDLNHFHILTEQQLVSSVDPELIEFWTDRLNQINSGSYNHFDEKSVDRIKQIRKKATEDLEKIIRFNDQLESLRNERQILWEESWKFFKSCFLPFAILAIGYKLSR